MFDATSPTGKQIICVLGMHRSGTSLITRVLSLLGMYLGPSEHLMKPNQFNPKGFWEHQSIVDIDDEILKRLGGNWCEPPSFPAGWEGSSQFADLRQQARALIQNDFDAAMCWGWKDPRTCLTLPFWKQLLPPLRYVICLRNPVDVARSLPHTVSPAHTMSTEKAMDLWHWYTRAAFEHSAGQPRLIVFYEDFMDDWRQQLTPLYQFVGNRDGEVPENIASAVGDAIAEELYHHRTGPEDVVDEARLAFPAKALFMALRLSVGLKARSRQFGQEGPLPELLNVFTRYSFEAREDLHTLQSQLAQLGEQVGVQQRRFEQQQVQLAEQTARAAEREAEGLREELAARDMLVGRLEAALAALQQSFQEEIREQIKQLRDDLETRLLAPPGGGRTDKKGIDRQQYGELIQRVRRLVASIVPANATIAVVSKGDPELLQLAGRQGWHFPQQHDGTYSGSHPKDSAAALAELQRVRAKGAEFLLFPATALWWLEYYKDFAAHLGSSHRVVARDEQTCVIFALQESSVGKPLPAPAQAQECGQLVRQVRGLIDSILPPDATVVVVSNGDPDLLDLGRRPAWHFPPDASGANAGCYPSDSAAAIAQLEKLRQTGAHFLVVPKTAAWWLDHHLDFARYLDANYRAIVRQRHVCTIFDLNGR